MFNSVLVVLCEDCDKISWYVSFYTVPFWLPCVFYWVIPLGLAYEWLVCEWLCDSGGISLT